MTAANVTRGGFGPVRRQGNGRLTQSVIGVVCLVLIGVAMVPMLLQVFMDKPLYYADAAFTLGNFAAILDDPEIRAATGATAVFCAMVVALSMLIGTAAAILLARTDLPGKALLGALFFLPLYLSPQIIGFGSIIAYGPRGIVTLWFEQLTGLGAPWKLYSLTGMAVITAIANAPITTLYCIVAARQQDPSHDAAARVMGAGPLRILRRISLPLMRPALIFALIMNIANAVETLAIPLIIGSPIPIRLLTTLIYERSLQAAGIPQYGMVAALALIVVGFIGLLFLLQRLLLRRAHRFVSIGPRAGAQRLLALGGWRWPACAAMVVYVAFAILAIVGAVILRSATFVLSPMVPLADSFTWDNFAELLTVESYRRSILNTLLLAVLGGALGTILVAAIALMAQRSDHPLHRLIDGVAQLPRVIPGLIVGLGVFYAAVYIPGLGALRNTIWLLLLAYLIRFMSAGYGIVSPALLQVTTDFDRAARVAGAGWSRTMLRIVLPLQRHALLSCFILLMVLIIKEYSAAVFLMAPGSEVIGATMLSLWSQGLIGAVAALAVVQIALTMLLMGIASRLFGVRLYD